MRLFVWKSVNGFDIILSWALSEMLTEGRTSLLLSSSTMDWIVILFFYKVDSLRTEEKEIANIN